MTDETTAAAAAAPASAAVPAHIIPAALPHPNTSGPLARGLTYLHHFEVELISDGARLWDAASDEGKQLLADIKGEKAAQADTIAAAKAAPALPNAQNPDPAGTAPANTQANDPAGQSAAGGNPAGT